MTSQSENSEIYWAKEFHRICSENSLSLQELERRERAAQRLKEAYSSIPWYKAQGEKDGDQFWRNLQSKAVLSD